MPIQPIGILPTFSNVNPSNITVPSNFRTPDTFNTQLQVYQELRARESHQLVKDRFEYEKLQNREKIRNSTLGYLMGGNSNGSGGARGAGGLAGLTPYSKRVMEELGAQEQQVIEDIYNTEDEREMQKKALMYKSSLKNNNEYQTALRMEAAIQNRMNTFLKAKPGEFDPKAVQDAVSGLQRIDPITGQINIGTDTDPINLSPDEYLASLDYEPFSEVVFEKDVDEALAGSKFAKEVELDSGAIATAKGVRFDTKANRVLKIQNLLDSNRKALRHYTEKFGLDPLSVTSKSLAETIVNSNTPIGELQADGTVENITDFDNIETKATQNQRNAAAEKSRRLPRGKGGTVKLKDIAFKEAYDSLIAQGISPEEALRRANIAANSKPTTTIQHLKDQVVRNPDKTVKSTIIEGKPITAKAVEKVSGISINQTTGALEIEIGSGKRLKWLKKNGLAEESLGRLDRHPNYDPVSKKVIIGGEVPIITDIEEEKEETAPTVRTVPSAGLGTTPSTQPTTTNYRERSRNLLKGS